MPDIRARFHKMNSQHAYVKIDGMASDLEDFRLNHVKHPTLRLRFLIRVTDRYGVAYREHMVFSECPGNAPKTEMRDHRKDAP